MVFTSQFYLAMPHTHELAWQRADVRCAGPSRSLPAGLPLPRNLHREVRSRREQATAARPWERNPPGLSRLSLFFGAWSLPFLAVAISTHKNLSCKSLAVRFDFAHHKLRQAQHERETFIGSSRNRMGMAGAGTNVAEGAGTHRVAAGKEHGN